MPEATSAGSGLLGILARLPQAIEVVSVLIDVLAVGIIVVAIVLATAQYWRRSLSGSPVSDAYGQYRARLGRSLLLGLEILVAADVIRTVALEPTLTNIAVLGLLVLIRTFLSWTLALEVEGRWPWQERRSGGPEPPATPAAGSPDARSAGALATPSGDVVG
jgi:uncharacterized membrane protein